MTVKQYNKEINSVSRTARLVTQALTAALRPHYNITLQNLKILKHNYTKSCTKFMVTILW